MTAKILIVDDEQEILNLLKECISDVGYDVKTVGMPSDVLNVFSEFKPDLVLLDIWLGDSQNDGISLLKAIKKTTDDFICIMMSGHGSTSTAFDSMQAGAFSYLEKPFKIQRILLELAKAKEHLFIRRQLAALTKEEDLPCNKEIVNIKNAKEAQISLFNGVDYDRYELLKLFFEKYYKEARDKVLNINKNRKLEVFHKTDFAIREFSFWALQDKLGFKSWQMISPGFEIGDNFLILDSKTLTSPSTLERAYEPIIKELHTILVYNYDTKNAIMTKVLTEIKTSLMAKRNENTVFIYFSSLKIFKGKLDIPLITGKDLIETFKAFLSYYCKTDVAVEETVFDLICPESKKFDLQEIERLAKAVHIIYDDIKKVTKNMLSPLVNKNFVNDVNSTDHIATFDPWENVLDLPFKEAKIVFEKIYLEQQLERADGDVRKTAKIIDMDRTALYRKLKDII